MRIYKNLNTQCVVVDLIYSFHNGWNKLKIPRTQVRGTVTHYRLLISLPCNTSCKERQG